MQVTPARLFSLPASAKELGGQEGGGGKGGAPARDHSAVAAQALARSPKELVSSGIPGAGPGADQDIEEITSSTIQQGPDGLALASAFEASAAEAATTAAGPARKLQQPKVPENDNSANLEPSRSPLSRQCLAAAGKACRLRATPFLLHVHGLPRALLQQEAKQLAKAGAELLARAAFYIHALGCKP